MPLTRPGAPTRVAPAAPMPMFHLTDEQSEIMEAYRTGHDIVVEALAGTGKTTTLRSLAAESPTRPGVYLAFNKSIVNEAEGRFPPQVNVTTAHSLAYRAVGFQYADRLNSRRMSAQDIARVIKAQTATITSGTLNKVVLTRMAQATVAKFVKSADPSITSVHIPDRVISLHDPKEIAELVLPLARLMWMDMIQVDGKLPFSHDVYLKLWQMTKPRLPYDYIMFDEAQDADPVIAAIVAGQDAQRIYVGDQNQAIYGWRGAVDSMSDVQGAIRLPLTRSFRFGRAIAEQANLWLDLVGSKLRVVGHDPIESSVGPIDIPRAILCRTNGTALGWVLKFQEQSIPVALAPGDRNAGKDIERFAWAARSLMSGEGTDHPELVGFSDWSSLLKFVDEEEETADLKRMVGIVNRIGVSGVIDAVRNLVTEDKASITVSTAHKAKGMEWDHVRVADDFTPPDTEADEKADPADLMLAYVTVTRAKLRLDPGSLAEPGLWRI